VVTKKGAKPAHETRKRKEGMTIELTCPYCQFNKEVPRDKIPEGAKSALCPRCGQRFALSIPGVYLTLPTERPAPRRGAPWEKRFELGLWQGIYQTSKAVLFSPDRLFGSLSFTDGIREPLAFGLLIGSIGRMFSLFWHFLILAGGIFSFDLIDTLELPVGIIFVAILAIIPFFLTATIFFYTTVLHLLLLIVSGGKNGYQATFRVVSYSQAVQALALIPIIGSWIGGIWQLTVMIIGLREIHETSYLRVILAFLIPVILFFLLVIAVLVPLFMYLTGDSIT
jgi:hypothetical protein